MTGENWFKSTTTKDVNYQQFLIESHQDVIFHKDIPRSYLQEEAQQLLNLIQSYITCEGRYGRTFIYHFRLLMHFKGLKPMNIPYFLLKSLTKMVRKVQRKP